MSAIRTIPMARQLAGARIMVRTLFYGPYLGEFGHELIGAAVLRGRVSRGRWQRIVVCSRPGREALYEFADEYIPHDLECVGMCERTTGPTAPRPAQLARFYMPATNQMPPIRVYGPVGQRIIEKEARFAPYGKASAAYEDCVVIHARNRPHVPSRNWPQRNWHRLAKWLFDKRLAKRLVCIGTREHALTAEGCLDMRGAPLELQMDILASARLIIGPSSGPVHLASHCTGKRKHGCPHVVWVGGGAAERRDTGNRYRKLWNPFHTPVSVIEAGNWQPKIEKVKSHVSDFLARLNK